MYKMYLGKNPIIESGSSDTGSSGNTGGSGNTNTNTNAPKYINRSGTHYRLIFEDDFDGTDINKDIWSSDYRAAYYKPWYTCGSDYWVEDSILNLRVCTNKRTLGGASWAAAVSGVQSVQSSSPDAKNDFRPFYGFVSQEGYYELKCRMYAGLDATLDGSHFAWWMTGVDDDNGKDCEYDMIEHFGLAPKVANLNVYGNKDTDIPTSRKAYTADFDIGTDWHTWGFLWEEGCLTLWLDDKQIVSMNCTTPNYPMMQWLTAYRSLGERANYWAGEYDPNQPDMISQIEYLRIYKKVDTISTEPVTVVSYDPINVNITAGEYTINPTSGRLTAVPLHCYVYWNDGSRTEHIVRYDVLRDEQISILDNGGTFKLSGFAMGIGIPIEATINVAVAS